MPPVNTTPATALTITFPYAINTDPTGGATGSETPSCMSDVLQTPLWYKYTGDGSVRSVGISWDPANSAADYFPGLAVYTGSVGSLTQLDDCCWNWDDNPDRPRLVQVGIEDGVTYFFVFYNNFVGPGALSNLVASFTAGADTDWVAGDFIISNDTKNFPLTVIDKTAGTILSSVGFPAFEQAAMLPNGTFLAACLNDAGYVDSFKIYTKDLELVATITSIIVANQHAFGGVATDGTHFYVNCGVYSAAGSNGSTVYKISAGGVVDPTNYTIAAPGGSMNAMAVHSGIIYWNTESMTGDTNKYLRRYDLTSGALADLVTLGANERFGRDLEVTEDGLSIIANHMTALQVYTVKKYSLAAGALEQTYAIGTFVTAAGGTPRFRIDPTNTAQLVTMTSTAYSAGNSGTMTFQRFTIATAAQVSTFDTDFRKDGSSFPDFQPMFALSQSCPLLIAAVAGSPVVPTVLGPGGIYQLVPGRTKDTLYVTLEPDVTTEDVAILDPSATTYLAGDEQ
jgi:hypothetical protein